ncbi:hypothetical protein [Methylotuvimicrobium sp. KM2]|uniref:hypothetical protein n=1 Tax=Methylotuvimicrobium sp. KM2 TaxID=3133976 RepID=UPI00310117A4
MNTHITAEKNTLEQLIEAQGQFIDHTKEAMNAAFRIGEILLRLKQETPHGQFESVLKNDTRVAFTLRHAQRFMRIAQNKALVLEHTGEEALSLREMDRIVAKAKPRKEPEHLDDDEEVIDRLMIEPPQSLGMAGQEEAEDAEFTEIEQDASPAPAATAQEPEIAEDYEYSELDQLNDTIAELASENERLQKDNDHMRSIFDDDNHTAAAIKEIEKKQSLIDGLQGTINGLVNENAVMKKELNKLDRRCKALDKKLKEAGL